jgi:hypothetical protein
MVISMSWPRGPSYQQLVGKIEEEHLLFRFEQALAALPERKIKRGSQK